MGMSERRAEIMRVLCRRRHETISNLAHEFGVSERTILRDIEILSVTEPIYTQCGGRGGGVYVTENYSMERMYMSEKELEVLRKLACSVDAKIVCNLNEKEKKLLKTIISQYTKPNLRKEKNNDKTRKRII